MPVPRLGGIAVFAAMMVGLLVSLLPSQWTGGGGGPGSALLGGILLGGAILFTVGLVDDVRDLRPVTKFLAQVVAAVIVYTMGFRIDVLSVGASFELSLGWLSLPLTVLWIVGVTNAFNLIDGLDGLASGIALVALGTTLVIALMMGHADIALICVALLGALLGFLPYNFSPARIFLGDSGSLFIGFLLAVLSVRGSMKSATAVLAIVPLFALALPILDTSLAIVRRWLRGTPLSGADARHIHHQLLARGLTHRRAVSILYLASSAFAVLGLSLALSPPTMVLWVAGVGGVFSVLLLLYGMRSLQYHEFAEASAALMSAARKSRRVIQDRIYAQDLAQVIRLANSREEISAILEDSVSSFGFLHLEVCRESARGQGRARLQASGGGRAWRLEYPVGGREDSDDDPYVLRVWCNLDEGFRPYGAERVAQILAPAIEAQLRQWVQAPVIERHAEERVSRAPEAVLSA